jgi:hypothetical protein
MDGNNILGLSEVVTVFKIRYLTCFYVIRRRTKVRFRENNNQMISLNSSIVVKCLSGYWYRPKIKK